MAASPMSRPRLTTNNKYTSSSRPSQDTRSTRTPSNDYFSTSRKRSRADSSMGKSTYNNHDWTSCNVRSPEDDTSLSTESLHVNDRYRLKGGFDTPGLLATGNLDTPLDLDLNARQTMRDPEPRLHITDPSFAGPLARERNGYPRRPTSRNREAETSPSWTRLAITLPFSIAGKMFSFGTTVLKGFYAGDGQGFEFDKNAPELRADLSTPVPGSWYESPPHQGFMGDFEQDNTPTSTRPPPNKRRLTDKDSWVMVGTPDLEVTTPPTSAKRQAFPNLTPRRPASLRTTARKAASRRQSYNNSAGSPATLAHHISEPPRLSMPLTPTSRHSPQNSIYVSPDAEKFAKRQAKQERAADKAMSSVSRQLEELIRQGQAALGTKFSVEDNGFDDEGFVDDY